MPAAYIDELYRHYGGSCSTSAHDQSITPTLASVEYDRSTQDVHQRHLKLLGMHFFVGCVGDYSTVGGSSRPELVVVQHSFRFRNSLRYMEGNLSAVITISHPELIVWMVPAPCIGSD